MLDRKFIVENAEAVKTNCAQRGVPEQVDRLIELELRRREKLAEAEELNRQANEVARQIGPARDPAQREQFREQGRLLREQKEAAQQAHDELDRQVHALQLQLPNMADPRAPIGADDHSNLEIRRGKYSPRTFSFQPLDHLTLGEQNRWIDFEGGARTTGSGFYFLRGELVLLDLALQRFAVEHLMGRGFTPMVTPDLAQDSVLEGIGFMPRGPETQVYSIENSDLSLVGTAEITLGGLYREQTVMLDELPIRMCGISHCYRTEAGAAGRASRGLYRVHQFTKIEMFAFTAPEASSAMHEELLEIECELFDLLEIPFRVVDTATGDLGGPAYRKFDLEAWMPGRGEGGEWGEVTSTSNCTDYQCRRLNARFRVKDQKGTRFMHSLNGTALALSRAIIAILENHQNEDGSVSVPEVLRTILGRNVLQPGTEY